MAARIILPILLTLAAAAAAAPAPELHSRPDGGVGCETLAAHAYREVPALFVAGDPDSLLYLLDRWEDSCGPHEVITRARLLGAIWDGAFDESLYGRHILADLLQRADEMDLGSAPDAARASYDVFTGDLAGQLLPHQPGVSLEAFFCLFYGGKTEQAWALLEEPELAESALVYRLDLLRDHAVFDSQWTLGLGLGSWGPQGGMEFVGTKSLLSLQAGLRDGPWLMRFLGEWHHGRTDRPYVVTGEGGENFVSDRWDTWLVGAELGYGHDLSADWEGQAMAGAGLDLLVPFQSDNMVLDAVQYSVGLGVRTRAGDEDTWTWGLDVRHEWIADRPVVDDNLGGTAWSLRIVVERVFQRGGREARHLQP